MREDGTIDYEIVERFEKKEEFEKRMKEKQEKRESMYLQQFLQARTLANYLMA